ncbi:MAG: formylmethanofuran dehydrogenase [Clostridia bacterium]|nr:formylmethanofuran dehydrogenase [Clostridia bacterium]
MIDEKQMWERCANFHGHVCGGLTIGYKAALYAIKLLDLTFSEDEDIVCISENDACGVDAIQVILGCSVGKGNLLFHMRGKQAFSFINRDSGKSVRLVLKDRPKGMTREESFNYMQEKSPEELFDITDVKVQIPERAKIFDSIKCELCGEITSENMIRLQEGKRVCLDCYLNYNRFDI